MLTPVETFWLQWHRTHQGGRLARQAEIILGAEAGTTPRVLAARHKLTPSDVQRLLARFHAQRLEIFPRPALLLDELLEVARVEMAHARQVADLALTLFDLTQSVHALPRKTRALLEVMALLHNVGVEVDEPRHHTAGRDVLMAMKLAGYSDEAQRMIACAIRFHRKRAQPGKEALFQSLPPALQAQTLSLSALLRSADGLDYSQSQTTHIADLKITPDTITLHLTGPCAETDGERAVVKADLWLEVFGQAWRLAPDVAQLAQQPLAAQTPVSRVIVRALADQLVRWEAAQPAAIAGDAPALKAMRAAARRARAGLGLFEPFVKKKVIKSLRVRLKQAEKMLGAVRDWDVLLIAAQAELGEAAFIEQWRGERVTALQDAERWLASAEAGELRAAWEAILAEPPIRAKYDTPLVDNAEFILLTPVETLRTLAAALNVADLETYHALRRVGIKRVRFALEFLAPALGPQADEVLKEIVKAQDRLGFLNDACVMREKLIHWLAQHPEDEVARQYASACEAAIQTHLRKFARDWAAVQPDILTGKLRALLWPRPAIG